MAEPTLTLSRTELRLAIGDFSGYGLTAANWTTAQSDKVDVFLGDGLRQVYSPMPLPGERTAHKWSFLYPVHQLTTTADQDAYLMPDDFGGMDGTVVFGAGTNYREIRIVGDGQLRESRQISSTSGIPAVGSLRPVKSDGSGGQRTELVLHPTPDAEYALTFRYRVRPDSLTADRPYPIGAALLSQLVKESCLAAAEIGLDGVKGVHWTRFTELLATAIAEDRAHEPEFYGYNGNESPIGLRDAEFRSRSGLIEYGA